MWTISHVEPCRTRVFDTRFPFLHFLLHSPYSSFSPYTSPIDSSNLGSGATTQPHGFIISWHQSKNPNPKITILALEQLPKFGFVDLGTGAACICWSQHQSALGFCFVLCFCFCFVLFFCFFFFLLLGLLSSEVGLPFWQLEKSAKGKMEKEKQRKWNSSV